MTDYTIDPGATIDRLIAERDAALADVELLRSRCGAKCYEAEQLQQRLAAADERVDVLEGLLCEAWEYDIGTPLKRKIIAALKSAEGGGDEPR